jgi:hypothetical protein
MAATIATSPPNYSSNLNYQSHVQMASRSGTFMILARKRVIKKLVEACPLQRVYLNR